MIDTILLHFLDKEVIELLDLDNKCKQNSKIYKDLRFATKLAFLICNDKVIIPASNYFESPFAKDILSEFKVFIEGGFLSLISSSTNSLEFLERKQEQYATDPKRYPLYFKLNNSDDLANSSQWIPRNRSATKDISRNWTNSIDNRLIWERLYEQTSYVNITQFESELSKVPERLENAAFIPDFVIPLINLKNSNSRQVNNHLNKIITKAYIESFLQDFDAVCMNDFRFFDTSIILPSNINHIPVRKVGNLLKQTGQIENIKKMSGLELLYFRETQQWKSTKQELFTVLWGDNASNNNQLLYIPEQDFKDKHSSIIININNNQISNKSQENITMTDKSKNFNVGDVGRDFNPTGSPILSDDADINNLDAEYINSNENVEPKVATEKRSKLNLWTMFVNFLSIGQGVEFSIRLVYIIPAVIAGISAYVYSQWETKIPDTPASDTIPEQVIKKEASEK